MSEEGLEKQRLTLLQQTFAQDYTIPGIIPQEEMALRKSAFRFPVDVTV